MLGFCLSQVHRGPQVICIRLDISKMRRRSPNLLSGKTGRKEREGRRAERPRESEVGRRQEGEGGRSGGRKGEFLATAASTLSLPLWQ